MEARQRVKLSLTNISTGLITLITQCLFSLVLPSRPYRAHALACRRRAASAAAATWPLGEGPTQAVTGVPQDRCEQLKRCANAKSKTERKNEKRNKTKHQKLLRAWIVQPTIHPLCFACLVVPAGSLHPIPFRTRPLNSPAPMVLRLKTRESRSPPGMQNTKILLTNDVKNLRPCHAPERLFLQATMTRPAGRIPLG